MSGRILLLGGPAGAGKSTLARAWCGTRSVAAHLQLDEVRETIVQGLADPLHPSRPGQTGQWVAAVEAVCAMARAFVARDIDVAVDDVMLPDDVERHWRPLLAGAATDLVIVLPRREVVLDRGTRRPKAVPADIVVDQYARSAAWTSDRVLDTSDLTVDQSVGALVELVGLPATSL